MSGKVWFIRIFWLFFKNFNIFIQREICKRRHCPPSVTLALLLFIVVVRLASLSIPNVNRNCPKGQHASWLFLLLSYIACWNKWIYIAKIYICTKGQSKWLGKSLYWCGCIPLSERQLCCIGQCFNSTSFQNPISNDTSWWGGISASGRAN